MGLNHWNLLNRDITACASCPRLIAHCEEIATTKRKAFRHCNYWGRPVSNFGDRQARLLIVGLAPERTGPIAPEECSPGTEVVNGFIAHSSGPDSAIRQIRLRARTVYNCEIVRLLPFAIAHRLAINPPEPRSRNANRG